MACCFLCACLCTKANLNLFVQPERVPDPLAWVTSANLRQVRQRLGELRQVRAQLHQEERLLHARRQELDPASGRPLKYIC